MANSTVVVSDKWLAIACSRCYVVKPRTSFPAFPPSVLCTHDSNVCSECVSENIQYQLALFPTELPFCPSYGCVRKVEVPLPSQPSGVAREQEFESLPRHPSTTSTPGQASGKAVQSLQRESRHHEYRKAISFLVTVSPPSETVPSTQPSSNRFDKRVDVPEIIEPVAETAPSPVSSHDAQIQLLACQICMEDLLSKRYSRTKPSDKCRHASDVCRRCLRRYLKTQIEELGNVSVRCPVPDCGEEMSYSNVKKFAKADVFERYDALLLRKNLGTNPNFVWCKNPKCSSGQIHDSIAGASVIVICAQCGSKACSHHDIIWHDGLTCTQYDEAKSQKRGREAAVETYFSQHTKQCPQCKSPIEKISGCDHMTCRPPGGCGSQL
ncbi:hypothetical protein CALCODRAFT_489759 [Calocera cornea HHB12733]|uniref:RBR-type E3 ubiquitin transferase n=1 Tax=Calocera cornea HHB12733 TaxID=1353952 RepID=A0A165JY35_9BASI|nr:hypothetical protein CALCODRAFT_489759 [Calocera cornea HHB12733]